MNLYEQIRTHFYIPDAFVCWKPYRDLLSDYLLREAGRAGKQPTLAILGAGYCNDIDLRRIRSAFSEITLIDYDEQAMRVAVRNYGLEGDSHICIQSDSLTGVGDSQYEQFCTAMQDYARSIQGSVSVQELDVYAISLLQSLVSENIENVLESTGYDYIWCVGVHSQLNAMFSYIYRVFWENLHSMHLLTDVLAGDGPADSAFMAYLHELNTGYIHQLHDNIFKTTKEKVFIGCEVDKIPAYYSGMYLAEEMKVLTNPIEGAYQGIMDVRSRGLHIEERIACWPFDVERQVYYDMLIQKIKVYEGD